MAVLSTITQQYNFARQFKAQLNLWNTATQTLIMMASIMGTRGWQTGGAEEIADTSLDGSTVDPTTQAIAGPCLMLTSAQLTADLFGFFPALAGWMQPYVAEFNRLNINY